MNTQTHILMSAVLFGGRIPKRAWAAALGGVLPDIPMFVIVGALKFYGIHDVVIFGIVYWQPWWQITNGISHNFWAWGGLLLASVLLRERRSLSAAAIDGWSIIIAFAASGLLHVLVDFLCHREDAHMSLWPVSYWKFVSPVSYWDSNHYGNVFSQFETVLGLALALVLFQRFHNKLLRFGLAAIALLYVAMPLYWTLTFG